VKDLMGHAGITTRRCYAIATEAVGDAMRNATGWQRETV
jgi:hypothetical protein